tara:strand:+ start:64 stop:363 length:300 start_codon:yes stop_codon:yes gene_type:complete
MVSFTANASVVSAYLHHDDYYCVSDHLVFETSMGYVTAEWYLGTLYSDNYFYGDFNSYGFKDVYSSQQDAENEENRRGRIWIDDYMLSRSSAMEWCQAD